MGDSAKTLFLCAGLQSSGSTLASWCFLQRSDMDGVLDGESDLLPVLADDLGKPFAWFKTTISSFRLRELVDHYQHHGWTVHPILMVRDVRKAWASLLRKPYIHNGLSAEDPPLRLRFRRFKEDWELSRQCDWPVLRYESLLDEPESTLRAVCAQLSLPWDDAMVRWPKTIEQIADPHRGNDSFNATRGANLTDTISHYSDRAKSILLAGSDLDWLESEFREFNEASGYPAHVEMRASSTEASPASLYKVQEMRRYKWELQRKPIRWLLEVLGVRDRSLKRRFLKNAG